MTVYYIYILIALICVFREHGALSESQRRWNLICSLIPVFVLMAFKGHKVGSDTPNYIYQYQIINDDALYQELYERIEPGYDLMQKMLHNITPDPLILFVVVALITCVSCYYFFRDNCRYSCTALYFFMSLGYFSFIMSGLRQTIAMSICLFSFSFIKKKRLYKFLALIMLAMTFHKSAIFFVPAYFFANQELKGSKTTYLYSGILVLFFFADKLLLTAEDIVGYKYGVEQTGNGQMFFGLVAMITYLAIKNKDVLITFNRINLQHLNINFLSFAMWTVRLVSRTAERVALYFMPYTVIVLTEYVETVSSAKKNFIRAICILIATYLLIHRIEIQEDLNNFKFFFQ